MLPILQAQIKRDRHHSFYQHLCFFLSTVQHSSRKLAQLGLKRLWDLSLEKITFRIPRHFAKGKKILNWKPIKC